MKNISFREGEPHMRIANALFVGSIAALLTAPVLAKNSEAQKMEEDKSAPPPCHASIPRKPSARSAEVRH
jgi:hypothetical protein